MLIIRNTTGTITFPTNYHSNKDKYRNLVTYNLLDNNQFDAEPRSFTGLVNLFYMKISGNTWSQIKNETFAGLEKLERLDLSNNEILTIDDGGLLGLPNLISLDLTQNQIKVIQSKLFHTMQNLEYLMLGNNNIASIEKDAFQGLPSLTILDITHNHLKTINAREINVLSKLVHLYLGHNQIDNIFGEFALPEIHSFHVQCNNLEVIPEELFKNTLQLAHIDLSFNKLRNLTEETFLRLPLLLYLNLRNNSVSINAASFSHLRKSVYLL